MDHRMQKLPEHYTALPMPSKTESNLQTESVDRGMSVACWESCVHPRVNGGGFTWYKEANQCLQDHELFSVSSERASLTWAESIQRHLRLMLTAPGTLSAQEVNAGQPADWRTDGR